MSFQDQARQPADTPSEHVASNLERAVRACLDSVIEAAARDRAVAVDAAIAATRTEADAVARRAVAMARAEVDAEIEAAVAAARAEVDGEVEAALDRARAAFADELDAAVKEARRVASHDAETAFGASARDAAEREFDATLAAARETALADQERAVEEARADAMAEAAAEAEVALAKVRAEHADAIDRLREQLASAQQELESARPQLDDARDAAGPRVVAPPDVQSAAAGSSDAVAPAPAIDAERDAILAATAALRDAVAHLDEATSLSECLDALSDAVSQQAARSMVFVIRGHALRAWRLSGFGEGSTTASAISVPLDLAGDLWQVAERGRSREVHPQAFGRDTDPALAFARLDEGAPGLAIPLCVSGKSVAIVYADAGAASGDNHARRWAEAVEIVARHASRCLEVLTAARSAGVVPFTPPGANGSRASANGGEAQVLAHVPAGEATATSDIEAATAAERYARLLVSEVKLYNEAAVRVARHKRDIRVRLRAEIERARRLYHDRVAASLPTRDEIFELELVRILADGQPELLGSDLPEAV